MVSINENEISTGSYSKSPPVIKQAEKKISKDDENIDNKVKTKLTGGGLQKMKTFGTKTSPLKVNNFGGPKGGTN